MVMQKVGGLASCSGTPGLRFESTLCQSKPTLNQTILARISMWDALQKQQENGEAGVIHHNPHYDRRPKDVKPEIRRARPMTRGN